MSDHTQVLTVCLNPTIDRSLEVPNLTIGAHQKGREIYRIPGGKALNVSMVLSRLGVRSVATGFLGRDNRAEFDEVFRDSLMVDQFFPISGRTRENVTLLDPETRTETHIRDEGPTVSGEDIARIVSKIGLLCRPGTLAVFSGSLPPGIEFEQFAHMVDSARKAGARVAVDTSGPALTRALDARPWLIKPNCRELSELLGRTIDGVAQCITAGTSLLEKVEVVIVSFGAEGAALITAEGAWHGRAEMDPESVVSTVGCGDALLAGYISAETRELDPPDALAEAVACASAAATSVAPGEFDVAALATLRARVTVSPVDQR